MQMLIFGSHGRTGRVVCRLARAAGWELLAPTHAECDLLRPEAVSDYVLAHPEARAVVNCAATSALERCLDDPLSAHLTNAVSPAAMALACRHTGARFVHLSTDYVLDGRRPGKKPESARCKPINTYAESKLEGELEVMEHLPESLILRVSWVCGNAEKPSFVESTLERALQGQPLAAIADKYSLPTHAEDIARVVLALIPRAEVCGTLHVTSSGEPLSWHECAGTALECAVQAGALPGMPPLTAQRLEEATFFRDPRPRHTAMDNAALLSLGIPMPTAQDTLRRAALAYLRTRGLVS